MNKAFLGLGGNLGDRRANLEKAMKEIEMNCGEIVLSSRLYETESWGSVSKHPYLNCVIVILTQMDPYKLLSELQKIESKLGRNRNNEKYSDRAIDIDILYFNSEIINRHGLQVPHPRLHLRNFVLVPLFEIAPAFKHPLLKLTSRSLLKRSPDTLPVEPVKLLRYICIEGNIGSGKSTLARKLAPHLKASLLSERFEKNNLLPLFYDQPGLYAFPLEYSFLISRYEQIMNHFKDNKGMVVSDYSFFKSLWFARANLQKKEFRLFKKHFRALSNQLPQPDLVVHLKTSVSNLRNNIARRNRLYEKEIGSKYLKTLNAEYNTGIKELSHKLLTINVRKYHTGLEKSSIKTIDKFIKENFGRNT